MEHTAEQRHTSEPRGASGTVGPPSLPLPPPFLMLLDSSFSSHSLNSSLPALCTSLSSQLFPPSAVD